MRNTYITIAFLVISTVLRAQPCVIGVDIGPDKAVCSPGGNVQLNGNVMGDILGFEWSPTTGLNNPNILNPIATVNSPITYTLSVQGVDPSVNLITNGDFEAGNTGFSSSYTFLTGPLLLGAYYAIVSNPMSVHPSFSPCGDHTTGAGQMMVVNGTNIPNTNVWCQTVAVTPNTDYAFSAWLATVFPPAPAQLQFSINGVLLGNTFNAPAALCQWQQFFETWNSGAVTSATICIVNQNTILVGNDFALDDIFFSPLCEGSDEVAISVVQPQAVAAPLAYIDCNESGGIGITLNGTGSSLGPNITYNWTTTNGQIVSGGNTLSPVVNSPGSYVLHVVYTNGPTICSSQTTVQVLEDPDIPFAIALSTGDIDCNNPTSMLWGTGSSTGPAISYAWTTFNGSILNGDTSLNAEVDAAGTYTLLVTNTANGCTASASVVVAAAPLANDTTYLSATTCDLASAGVFSQTLLNQYGCDSTIITTILYVGTDPTLLNSTTCDATLAGVFTNVYASQLGCDSIVVMTVDLLPSDTTQLFSTSCDPSAAGVFVSVLTGQNGCDSTVVTTVSFSASDTTLLSSATCDATMAGVFTNVYASQLGCDSIVIETVALLPSDTTLLFSTSCDPSAAGVFVSVLTGQNGCDSTIVETVSFSASDTTLLSSATCDATMAGVFTNVYASQLGCDSIVIMTVDLLPSDTTLLFSTSCDPSAAGVFVSVLTGQNGCDSTIVETVSFSASDTTLLSSATCDATMAGIFTNVYASQLDCDSIVIMTVDLLPSDTTLLFSTSCDPSAAGVFVSVLTGQNGCDSTIVETVSFSASDTTLLSSATCDATMAGVFTNVYASQLGCDSIVIATVNFLTSDTTLLSSATCDAAMAGVFMNVYASQLGCDSIVIETVTLLPSDTTLLFSTSCDATMAGVFTNVYVSQSSCDSTVIETVNLLPSDTTLFSSNTCDPSAAGVFTNVYVSQSGCDSTVIMTVDLLPSDTTLLNSTTCDATMAGVFTNVYASQLGCDSTVIETVALLQSDTTFLNATSCDLADTGVFVQVLMDQNGCDSTIVETITLLPSDTILLFATSCDPLDTGIVTTVLVNQNGCDSTIILTTSLPTTQPTMTVEVLSDFGGFAISCSGGADGSALASMIGGVAPYTYLWSNNAVTGQVNDLAAGDYQVTMADANGCTAAASILLSGPPSLTFGFVVNDLDCFSQNDGSVFVEADGGVAPYLYSLNGGAEQTSPVFEGLVSGIYVVGVEDANGCGESAFIGIQAPLPVDVELGEDQTIEFGEGTELKAIVNLPFDSLSAVLWTGLDSVECANCLEQPIVPLYTTTYTIAVTAENGCSDSDSVTVSVDRRRQVYVPNAFSPNGDGINDNFLLFAKPNTVARVKTFLVFDRWGESVHGYHNFQPGDPASGWDGGFRGHTTDAAVYVWFAVIEFLDGETEVFEGDVTVVR